MLRFNHKDDVRFEFVSTSNCLVSGYCFTYYICMYLCILVSKTGATSGVGTAYLFGASEFTHPRYLVVFMLLNINFSVQCFVGLCLCFCPDFIWSLYCQPYCQIRGFRLSLWYLQTFLAEGRITLKSSFERTYQQHGFFCVEVCIKKNRSWTIPCQQRRYESIFSVQKTSMFIKIYRFHYSI